MAGSVAIGAMADYLSAAFFLSELRSQESLRKWVQRCHQLGISRLFFRVSVYGDFLHHTCIERRLSMNALLKDYQDEAKRQALLETEEVFRSFDALAEVTEATHNLGMEVVPWITLSDEGIPDESYTFFAGQHPQYLMRDREGRCYDRALSYGHPEVRQYRISLIQELGEYGVDGVFLDFTRWLWKGHMKARKVSLVDDNGVCLFGYDEPVVEAYRQKTGRDPTAIPNGDTDWVRFRAEATNTLLLRELRAALPQLSVYAYFPPRGFLSEMLLDVPSWIEEGLVDELCVCPFSDVPDEGRIGRLAYAVLNDFARQFCQLVRTHRGSCRVGAPILVASSYGPHPDFVAVEPWSFLRPEVQEAIMRSAARGGADELIFYDLCQEYNGETELWAALEPICQRILSGASG